MSDSWVRIDDRLVHAQVLMGWAPRLAPRRIVLAHDGIAADAGLSALYRDLGEGDTAIEVQDVETAAAQLQDPVARRGTFFVLGSVRDVLRLVELGAAIDQVTLGGLHERPETRPLTDFVFLSRQDAHELCALIERGIEVVARDVPTSAGQRVDTDLLAHVWT